MSRDWYCIHVSLELLDRLKELQEKFNCDSLEDLIEYILDKSEFLEYE